MSRQSIVPTSVQRELHAEAMLLLGRSPYARRVPLLQMVVRASFWTVSAGVFFGLMSLDGRS